MDTPSELTWQRVAAFVRQHSHDLRNHLNGIDLEAALLNELMNGDVEARASLGRLRGQIRSLATELRGLSAKFADPLPANAPVAAGELFLVWKDQAVDLDPARRIEWHEAVGDARVNVDIDIVARAFRELLINAFAFGSDAPLRAEAAVQGGFVEFRLVEPKDGPLDVAEWGRVPFESTRRGRYGLGLWAMDRNIAASGGKVQRHYDPQAKTLTTALSFAVL